MKITIVFFIYIQDSIRDVLGRVFNFRQKYYIAKADTKQNGQPLCWNSTSFARDLHLQGWKPQRKKTIG
jgi:hypothetical protein